MDNASLQLAVAAITPAVESIISKYVTPAISKFSSSVKLSKETYYVPTEEHFQEYLHRTYKKLYTINTLVFKNTTKALLDVYLPLTIVHEETQEIRYSIDSFPNELLNLHNNIMITDTAGMGKSTLMKYIFLTCVEKYSGVPIFIELRRLSKNHSLIDEIHYQLNGIEKEFNPDLLKKLLNIGGFIIILDGYDEISLKDRIQVTADIQDFLTKVPNNRYIITSRPESALKGFTNFTFFTIEPLSKNQAFQLLRKYDPKQETSNLLIKKIEEIEIGSIDEFLVNPLLVSLLYTAFEYKPTIPFKKHLFYRQVFDANFEDHDLTKGDSYTHDKKCELEIDDFHRVLRHIGFNCMIQDKIEFEKDELLSLIKQSKNFCLDLDFNESDFLTDLISSVPLFTLDGVHYRWSHKSLNEYFAAQFIYHDAKSKQSELLTKLAFNGNLHNYLNTLDIYYDIDNKSFSHNVIFPILNDYLSVYRELDEKHGLDRTKLGKVVKRRIENTYFIKAFIISNKGNSESLEFELVNEKCSPFLPSNYHYKSTTMQYITPKSNLHLILYAGQNLDIIEMMWRRGNNICKGYVHENINKKIANYISKKLKDFDGVIELPIDPLADIYSKIDYEKVSDYIIGSLIPTESVKLDSKCVDDYSDKILGNLNNDSFSSFLQS